MSENFNVSPYYDDFDPSKNYHRILFKPGFAVQARELTQSQTILQNQISDFAQNIFTQNTPVSGGKVTTNLTCYYIKLISTFGTSTISVSNFLNADGSGRYITDSTGSVVAKVIAATDATIADPPTLIVTYLSGVQFTDGTTITTTNDGGTQYQATTVGSTGGSTCTGLSSTASVSDGVFYVVNGYSKTAVGTQYSVGNFVQVNPQTIILDKYDNTPSCRIGLLITENIVDYTSDSSLLDPAIGASNYEAPGADRYQITLTLAFLPLTLGNDSNFIELVRINNGQIISQVDGTVYSTIDDYFAKRDYETNGDYLVTPFTFTPSSNTFNSAQYDLTVSKGIAYVHGYRIENQSPLKLTTDRARSIVTVNNNDVITDYGSYYYVDTMHGFFNVTNMPTIDFHCVPANNIVTSSNNAYNATKIGTGFIRNLTYVADSGTSNSFVYRAYVCDINLNSFTSNVTSTVSPTTITLYDPTNKLSAVSNAYYGMTLTVTSGTSAGDIRNIIYYNATTFEVDTPFTVNPDTTSVISISPSSGSVESLVLPGANNTVTSSLNINTQFGKSGTTTTGIPTGDAILENTTDPSLVFWVGNAYVAGLSNTTYQSTKTYSPGSTGVSGTFNITAGTDLNFIGTAGAAQQSSIIKQYYTVIDSSTGQILDYTVAGASVSLDSGKQTLTFTNAAYANKTVYVIASVTITNGDTFPILKWKNLVYGSNTVITSANLSSYKAVAGDANTAVDLQLGQAIIQNAGTGIGKISLRVADMKSISVIYDTGSPSVQPTLAGLPTYTNVTNQYVFDNGQRDNLYDHASIQLLPGANPALGNLLVIFNYYSHINGTTNLGTGTASDGYFSLESYTTSSSPDSYSSIPTYKAKNGDVYRLGDSLDFRPSRINANTAVAFEYAGSGALMPIDLSLFASTYSYYLARKDLLVLSKDKSFQIVEGNPALNPIFPSQPTGSLLLANLTLDPYTAYIPGENPPGIAANLSVNPVSHNRWTKSDISDLQTRVNNLEYYTSLNLLEQNAQSLQIPDVNGLNRFKNGILVDDFSSFGTADTFNPDFSSNINIRNQTLGPVAIVDNFQLQNPIVTSSLGTLKNTNTFAVSSLGGTGTNIFTLPYTTANLVSQPLASNTVSLNPFGVTVYQGVASLFPPMDNWVDNVQSPALLITDPNMQVYQQSAGVNLTNAGDFASIPGTAYTTVSSASYESHNSNGQTSGGISPYGYVGFTATTTNTYASQLNNITTTVGQASVNSALSPSNGYLTNVSVLPYIRQQQIGFFTSSLLVNSPVSVWFDGQNVNQYVTLPNTIELTNVGGSFNQGDVVGFYVATANVFYPTARVEGTYVYPGTNNVRLYVSSVTGAVPYSTSTKMQNGYYDQNGNYTGNLANTAFGYINTGKSRIHSHGTITGVGGGYTISGQTYQIYAVQDSSNWGSFLNQYAVWGDLNLSASYNATFYVTPQIAGTYTCTYSTTGTTTFTANGSTVGTASLSPNYTSQATLTFNVSSGQVGNPLALAWNVTNGNATPAGTSGVGLIITDPNGNIVFTSTSPPQLAYNNATGEVVMPQGGAWFTGVTSLLLDQNATANAATYYQGAKITVVSTYTYSYTLETATYVPPPPPNPNPGKIICKKLSELGYFDKEMNEADQRFGRELQTNDRLAYLGYIRWAQTVVDLMDGQGSESLRKVILFWVKDKDRRIKIQQNIVCYYMDILARPWAEEMAYRMRAKGHNKSNPAGRMIMDFGLPLCRKVGKIQSNTKLPLAAKILAIWGTVTVLLVGVIAVSGTNAIINKVKSWFNKQPKVQTINS